MTMRHYALSDLTWTEFRDRLPEKPVILLPLGSQEEQGPQAPMGDYVLAEKIALMAAERCNGICAPVLPFGYADFFRGAPGGMQLRAETFLMILEDMIISFLDHGIEHVVICNGHSTNASLVAQVTHKVRHQRGLVVPSINLWRSLPEEIWREQHKENATTARGHGADPLTSIYMYLMPGSIRALPSNHDMRNRPFGLSPAANFAGALFRKAVVEMPLDALELSPSGVGAGDPKHAKAEIGAVMVDWLVTFIADFAAHFRGSDPRHPFVEPA
jgi:creatinine amidohydrolase